MQREKGAVSKLSGTPKQCGVLEAKGRKVINKEEVNNIPDTAITIYCQINQGELKIDHWIQQHGLMDDFNEIGFH